MTTPNNQPTPPSGKQFLCKSKGLDWPTPEPGFALWIENGEWFTAPEVDPKKFGPHKWTGYVGYREGQMGNCKCGCYMGSDRSSGPVDPFGACPQNPLPITPTDPATGDEPAKIAPGYNPDKLTDDQVGQAFRLLEIEEPEKPGDEWWNSGKWVVNKHIGDAPRSRNGYTIRRREGNETTTNEKGGEPCAPTSQSLTTAATVSDQRQQSAASVSLAGASNAPAPVRSQSQGQELLPCPFCGASEWRQDRDMKKWRRLTHEPDCFLSRDKPTRNEFISLSHKEAQQWNTRK